MRLRETRKKTLKITCPWCDKAFHISVEPKSDATGQEEKALTCLYCQQEVIITLPRRFAEKVTLLRGLKPSSPKTDSEEPSHGD